MWLAFTSFLILFRGHATASRQANNPSNNGSGKRTRPANPRANCADYPPFSRHGSRLRAIAHNQAQTAVLGLNQLTTGMFRALDRFSQLEFKDGDTRSLVTDRLLPRLSVYEMLHTLRLYHDPDLTYLMRIERAFPAGTSALLAVREDNDSMPKSISSPSAGIIAPSWSRYE